MKRRVLKQVTAVVLAGLAMLAWAPAARAQRADIGMNLGMPWYDWDALKVFADAVKQARGFYGYSASDPGNTGLPVDRDADGWPLADASVIVYHDASGMRGTYRLWFTTQDPSVDARTVEVRYHWSTVTSGSQTYDAATNTVRYDVLVSGDNALMVRFINTRGGVKNVKLMRPITPGSATSYDTTVTFTAPALDLCRKFGVLRFMQVGNALVSNMTAEWADRTRPSYCCQQSREFGGGGSAGVAYEYMAQLCNAVDADIYVCVPFLATDAYIDSLANLLRNTLEPQRKVWVEYSNELWNTGAADYDAHRNHDSALAEVNRGNSPLNFDGDSNEWVWAWRRAGKRGLEISRIFRRVFGDAAMMTRVRPLLMTQQNDGQATFRSALEMLLDYYNNPTRVADPHPPKYYFYGAGGSGYYGPSGSYDINTIWSSGSMSSNGFIDVLLTDLKLCATFGLKRVAYEAGPGFDELNAAQVAAWHDNRLTRAVIQNHDVWSNYGGDMMGYFTLTGWNTSDIRHSFLTSLDSTHTPKMNAIDSLNARPQAPITCGPVPPCAIDGDTVAARFIHPYYDPPSACRAGEWYSYVIRADLAGTYGVTVDYAAASTGAFQLYGDGDGIGAPAIVSGTHTTGTSTVYLEPGLHGIIVRVSSLASGRLSINRVNVTIESLASQPGTARPRAMLQAHRPSLRSVSGRLVVDPGRTSGYVVSTLDGRVLARGSAERSAAIAPVQRISNGIYLLSTETGRGCAMLVR